MSSRSADSIGQHLHPAGPIIPTPRPWKFNYNLQNWRFFSVLLALVGLNYTRVCFTLTWLYLWCKCMVCQRTVTVLSHTDVLLNILFLIRIYPKKDKFSGKYSKKNEVQKFTSKNWKKTEMAWKIVKKRNFLENTEKNGNSHFEKRNLSWKKPPPENRWPYTCLI